MREIILNVINSSSGIKDTDLILKVMDEVNPHKFDRAMFVKGLNRLSDDGEIVLITYIVPKFGVTAFYLPKGARVYVHKNGINE